MNQMDTDTKQNKFTLALCEKMVKMDLFDYHVICCTTTKTNKWEMSKLVLFRLCLTYLTI